MGGQDHLPPPPEPAPPPLAPGPKRGPVGTGLLRPAAAAPPPQSSRCGRRPRAGVHGPSSDFQPHARSRFEVLEEIDMMGSNRMQIFLLGLLVLAMFCSPGSALKCFQCDSPVQPCTKNVTCRAEDDACLQVISGGAYYHSCWKYANCNMEKIGAAFPVASARYACCQRDLCNAAGMGTAVSKATMIAGLLVVVARSFSL
ncbi:CD59 glycoprotein [Phascolarctos cinereus]|uniref:MAC-inhibitory protein n=1 Tax=Phascolarctos cinereus TaxID=38626 RepID=A0A6P5IL29_PHACI|nr:CD59 glycoprotein [Phascolarctos cinereus]